jgi:hypothetical protein
VEVEALKVVKAQEYIWLNLLLNRHFSQVIQESRIVVASDRDRGDFMNWVNLVVKMPRADC